MRVCKANTRLNLLMKQKGLTQKQLHARIKEICHTQVTLAILSKICSGKQMNVHVDTLIKICVALNVSPNELLDGEQYLYLFKKSFIDSENAKSIS
jgi:DNA-binding Xre family transcriptional regulator